jgi:AraC-like DNA-binding protein
MDASPAPTLNLLLRGGVVLLLVLIAATLWRDQPRRTAARLGAAFALGVAAATLASAPGFAAAAEPWHAAVVGLASGAMFVFWLFTRALFDDAFVLRPWHAAAWLLLAGIGVWNCLVLVPTHAPLSGAAALWLGAMPVAWALLAIAQSLASWREDLVEGRRALRTLIVATTAFYTLAQLLAAGLSGWPLKDVIDSTANAAGTAALTLFVAWRLLHAGSGGLFAPAGADTARDAALPHARVLEAEPPSPPDPRLVAALEALMSVDHVYREPQLGIGALAGRMGLPERQLRRLINQGLGHRNFSAFLNTYRLADAKRWLADREQADTPILTLAMDAGFQSLGPFNRAFKASTGMTPSEFRRCGGEVAGTASRADLAESGIG